MLATGPSFLLKIPVGRASSLVFVKKDHSIEAGEMAQGSVGTYSQPQFELRHHGPTLNTAAYSPRGTQVVQGGPIVFALLQGSHSAALDPSTNQADPNGSISPRMVP